MINSPSKINRWMLFKLPAAWLSGVRLSLINDSRCEVKVKFKWINQNPYRSMFWAVQGMAAELATGVHPFAISRSCEGGLRMFVVGTEAKFVKRAKGKIRFTCEDVSKARSAIEEALSSEEGVDLEMNVVGQDSTGDVVSNWVFKWNFRAKGGV